MQYNSCANFRHVPETRIFCRPLPVTARLSAPCGQSEEVWISRDEPAGMHGMASRVWTQKRQSCAL
eukprot:365747-Chlamydomonas_euryale.AAC.51